VNDQNYQYRKAVARHAFSIFPKQYLQSSLKRNMRQITVVPNLQSK